MELEELFQDYSTRGDGTLALADFADLARDILFSAGGGGGGGEEASGGGISSSRTSGAMEGTVVVQSGSWHAEDFSFSSP